MLRRRREARNGADGDGGGEGESRVHGFVKHHRDHPSVVHVEGPGEKVGFDGVGGEGADGQGGEGVVGHDVAADVGNQTAWGWGGGGGGTKRGEVGKRGEKRGKEGR